MTKIEAIKILLDNISTLGEKMRIDIFAGLPKMSEEEISSLGKLLSNLVSTNRTLVEADIARIDQLSEHLEKSSPIPPHKK